MNLPGRESVTSMIKRIPNSLWFVLFGVLVSAIAWLSVLNALYLFTLFVVVACSLLVLADHTLRRQSTRLATELAERKTAERMLQQSLKKSREELDILVQERTSELTMLTEQLRNLSVHLQQAREEERTKIAREVHDDLGQSLTALNMDLAFLQRNIPAEFAALTERTNAMAELIGMTMQSIRRISTDLRPGILDVLGLAAAIEWQAGEYEKRTGIACEVSCESSDVDLDRDCSTTLFRIFQESLNNISRHAKATKMVVSLNRGPESLVLTVTDNGKGIDEDQESGRNSFGLIGMRERALSLGGDVSITSRPNKGTEVTVRIPLHARETIR